VEGAATSIRAHIPVELPRTPDEVDWPELRENFIATLFARDRAEIDLWPSQLNAVDRVFDSDDDLVISLPTSSAKTRLAELCILACLGRGKRVMYVTPLCALSAQTELILEATFSPLGARVSSLYGSMGTSDFDEDVLRTSEIVVATPEKLDFGLRSDPSLLDDVGLVVLDEGHMIGTSDREVRYEAQIQRLLHRSDADQRRLVCLSAVLPAGEELKDFVNWITDDAGDSGLITEGWRPTQQRFGLVEWSNDHARMVITVGNDRPFIPEVRRSSPATRETAEEAVPVQPAGTGPRYGFEARRGTADGADLLPATELGGAVRTRSRDTSPPGSLPVAVARRCRPDNGLGYWRRVVRGGAPRPSEPETRRRYPSWGAPSAIQA
jgi:hypothetical protein